MTGGFYGHASYRRLRKELKTLIDDLNQAKPLVDEYAEKRGMWVSKRVVPSHGSSLDLMDGWVFKLNGKGYCSYAQRPYLDGDFDLRFEIPPNRLQEIVEAKAANYIYNTESSSWLWTAEETLTNMLKLLRGGIRYEGGV